MGTAIRQCVRLAILLALRVPMLDPGPMTGRNRLHKGGRLNRAWPVHFTVDGQKIRGFPGDTLASALLANDIHQVGLSDRKGRPRGIRTARMTERDLPLRIETGGEMAFPATASETRLQEGLAATRLKRLPWPALGVTLLDRLVGWLPGGTESDPPPGPAQGSLSWRQRLANAVVPALLERGAASAPQAPPVLHRRFSHPEVAVVGAGVAGLMAALTAARAGARVLLIEADFLPGGTLLHEPWPGPEILGQPGDTWIDAVWAELAANPHVTLLPATKAIDLYPDGRLTLVERVAERPDAALHGDAIWSREWHVQAQRVILATGSQERPILFPGNDRPGILSAGALRAYMHRFAVLPGERVVVATADDAGYSLAKELLDQAGAAVAVVDPRREITSPLAEPLRRAGVDILTGSIITQTTGTRRITRITVQPIAENGDPQAGAERHILCDLVAMSGGMLPDVTLLAQAGGGLFWSPQSRAFLPDQEALPTGVTLAGSLGGADGWHEALDSGVAAAEPALTALGHAVPERPVLSMAPPTQQDTGPLGSTNWASGSMAAAVMVDLATDLTLAEADAAVIGTGGADGGTQGGIQDLLHWVQSVSGRRIPLFLASFLAERGVALADQNAESIEWPVPAGPPAPSLQDLACQATGGLPDPALGGPLATTIAKISDPQATLTVGRITDTDGEFGNQVVRFGIVKDPGDALGVLNLSGPGAWAILQSGCPTPLDAAVWPVGRADKVQLGPLIVVLERLVDVAGDPWLHPGSGKPATAHGLAVLSPAAPELRPSPRRAQNGEMVPAFRLGVEPGSLGWLTLWLQAAGAGLVDSR